MVMSTVTWSWTGSWVLGEADLGLPDADGLELLAGLLGLAAAELGTALLGAAVAVGPAGAGVHPATVINAAAASRARHPRCTGDTRFSFINRPSRGSRWSVCHAATDARRGLAPGRRVRPRLYGEDVRPERLSR
jgi:hypothetical protein